MNPIVDRKPYSINRAVQLELGGSVFSFIRRQYA